MTPARHELHRSSSLLLDFYGLAAEVTGLDILVDRAAEWPVSKVYRCCRGGLFELAKEESK